MFRNYLNITLRSLWKNRLYVSINILGLGVALACCIVAYLNYKFDQEFDAFHEKAAQVFKINSYRTIEGNPIPYGIAPAPIAPVAMSEISGIKAYTRYSARNPDIELADNLFNTEAAYADSSFVNMFSITMLKGDKKAYFEPSTVIISDQLARKIFSEKEPIGQTLKLIHDFGKTEEYTVGGVFEKFPLNSSFQFEILAQFKNYANIREFDENSWESLIQASFIELENPEQANSIAKQFDKYAQIHNNLRNDWQIASFYLESVADMAHNAEDTRGSYLMVSVPKPAVIAPGIMSMLLLLLACFNFMNTSIAISSRRLKEIGVRKVMGGKRSQIITQFLAENILLCMMALIVALVLSSFLVPAYSAMWDFIDLELNYAENAPLIGFLVLLLFGTGFLAGAYPAFYISTFSATGIFRGRIKFGGSNLFTKVLLTFQYSISLLAIISGIAFVQNAKYQENFDLGFEHTEIIVMPIQKGINYAALRDVFQQNPKIELVSGTFNHLGWGASKQIIQHNSKEVEVDYMRIGDDYDDATGLKVIEGRDFRKDSETDYKESALVNNLMVKMMGWENKAIGQTIVVNDTTRYTVIGVVQDFYTRGIWEPMEPSLITPVKEEEYGVLVARAKAADVKEVNKYMREKFKALYPDRLYQGNPQYDTLAEGVLINKNITVMFTFLAVIATLLSAIGLFTLVSLNILKKMKEIGVRKVLGASIPNIINTINKDSYFILIIASILGSAMAWFAVEILMESIWAYFMPMNVLILLVATAILLGVSSITIGFKVLQAALANPVVALKDE